MNNRDFIENTQEIIIQAAAQRQGLRFLGNESQNFIPKSALKTLSSKDYQGIVDYAPSELYLTVRSGTPVNVVKAELFEHKQMLAFDAASVGSIGGLVAANRAGSRRPFLGGIGDFLLGVKIINGLGQELHFGGQVMKNVAGFDLFRPQAGAFGQLGFILEVTFKVLPLPDLELTFKKTFEKAEAYAYFQEVWRHPDAISGAAYQEDHGELYLRLSGGSYNVGAACEKLLKNKFIETDNSFWSALDHHDADKLPFFHLDEDSQLFCLWLPPTSKALDLPGSYLSEWAGMRRWYKTKESPNAVFAAVEKLGGQAQIWQGSALPWQARHSLRSPQLQAVEKRLKQALDPHGIFNPDLSL